MTNTKNIKKTNEAQNATESPAAAKEPPKIIGETADARLKAKSETTGKTTGIKWEVLRGEIERKNFTATRIHDLDLQQSLESDEQKEGFKSLEIVTITLLSLYFENNIQKNPPSVTAFSEFIQKLDTLKTTDPAEIEAIAKLKALSNVSTSPLYPHNWNEFFQESYKIYQEGKKIQTQFDTEAEKPSRELQKAGNTPQPENEKESSIFSFFQKNTKLLLLLAGGAAASYTVYSLLSKDDKKDDKEESFFDTKAGKAIKWSALALGAGSLGYFIAGRLLGKEKLAQLFSPETWQQFLSYLEEGEISKALNVLSEGPDKNFSTYKDIAEKLSTIIPEAKKKGKAIKPEIIKHLAKIKYKDFISTLYEGKSALVEQIRSLQLEKNIPGGSLLLDQLTGNPEAIEQEQWLRSYLKNSEKTIQSLELNTDATVLDILAKLTQIEIKAPITPEQEEEKGGITEATETATGEIVGVASKVLQDLREEFKEKETFQKFLKKYEGNWSAAIIHPQDFFKELREVCKEDGLSMLINTGTIIITDGYKFVTFTSAKTLCKAALDLALLPSDDVDADDALWDYFQGTLPFIIVGGSYKFLKTKGGMLTKLAAGGEGAARGLLLPIEVAHLHIKAGQRIYRTAKGVEFAIKKLQKEALPKILDQETKFYAEIAQKYDQLVQARRGKLLNPKRWYSKLDAERIDKLRNEYLGKFVEAYNQLIKGDTTKTKLRPDTDAGRTQALQEMDRFLREQDAKIAASKATKAALANEPIYLPDKKTGSGDVTEHHYRFHNDEIILKEQEIKIKAQELSQTRVAAGETIPSSGDALDKWNKSNWENATKALCEEKYLTPIEIKRVKNGNSEVVTYRFAGSEVNFTAEEIAAAKVKNSALSEPELMKNLCYEKIAASVKFEGVKIIKGEYVYSIGGQEIKADEPVKLTELKEKFAKILKEKGLSMDIEKMAADLKWLKWASILEKTVGTTASVLVIYNLYTAKDKRKAVAENAAGLITVFGSSWLIGKKAAKYTKNPFYLTVVSLMGGLAVNLLGVNDPIEKLVEGILKDVPASQSVAAEFGQMLEKGSYRTLAKIAGASLERGILRRGVEKGASKLGFKGLTSVFEKKIGSEFLKKITKFAAEKGFTRILETLGWRGATTAALLADDATVIGVLDDIIAVGFMIWMGKDIIDIVLLMRNALKVNELMKERKSKPIKKVTPDAKSQGLLQAKLEAYGKTLSEITDLSEDDLFAIFYSIPEPIKITIEREGAEGSEEWLIYNGEAKGMAIHDGKGETIAEITDEDAEDIQEKLQNMEKEESKKPALAQKFGDKFPKVA